MCDCEYVQDLHGGYDVCVKCGEINYMPPNGDYLGFADNMENKSAPYKYSRTTHFRNTLARIIGTTPIDAYLVKKCGELLQGYPDNHSCHFFILKTCKMPYQYTSSIRRRLGYSMPDLSTQEHIKLNQMFEFFCDKYEHKKPANRKNLPSIEYLIYRFALIIDREDICLVICKRYQTLEKENNTDYIFNEIMHDFCD